MHMKYSVIIAEDEILLLDNLIKKVNDSNTDFEVIGKAQTGTQAYELIKQLHPDLLITDIRMPVMDGLELIKQVRDHYPHMDIIIISGYSEFEYAKTAIKYHVNDYLLKPIDAESIEKVLLELQNKIHLRNHNISEYFANESSGTLTASKLADMVKNYLIENSKDEVNMNQIAQTLNYSPSYLTKVFTNEYQCTPSKYLISLRIQQAEHMLIHNPDLTIRQIGEAVGYPDQGYFSRIFKKQIGYSPLEYRERQS